MARTDNLLSLLEAGARAEGLRHKAIASNIANLQTPGYRRVDIRFEEFLDHDPAEFAIHGLEDGFQSAIGFAVAVVGGSGVSDV